MAVWTWLLIFVFSILSCSLHVSAQGCDADVVFVVDSSGTINDADAGNWDLLKEFLVLLATEIIGNANTTTTRIGMIRFSDNGDIMSNLTEFRNLQNFINIIRKMGYIGGFTNTAEGLQMAQDMFNRVEKLGISKILILITDGKATLNIGQEVSFAENIRKNGIHIVAVGITDSIDFVTLVAITGDPNSIVRIGEFEMLTNITSSVIKAACPVTRSVTPGLTTSTSPPAPTSTIWRTVTGSHLYFADMERHEIFRMPASGGKHESVNISDTLRIDVPYAIAHDPIRNIIYWTELSPNLPNLKGIGRLSLDNGFVDFISTDGHTPVGLSVDPTSSLLYLAFNVKGIIQVVDFEARTRRTLINDGLAEPRAIDVDPINGWLYWSDNGNHHIGKAKIDGTHQHLLVTTGVHSLYDLKLDMQNSRLYFCEGNPGTSSVQSIKTDGSGRQTHFTDNFKLYSFFGIDVDDQFIYLSSWNPSIILRLPKDAINITGSLQALGEAFPAKDAVRGIVLVDHPPETTPEPGISKYVFLSLIALPILVILLAVFCFKRNKRTNAKRTHDEGEENEAYDQIQEMNMDRLPNNPALHPRHIEGAYESTERPTDVRSNKLTYTNLEQANYLNKGRL